MAFLRSTTFRFAALVFLLQIAGAALLLATVHVLTADQIADEAQAQAEQLRDDLLPAYREGGFPALARTVTDQALPGRLPGKVILLVDRNGAAVAGNLAEWPPSLSLRDHAVTTELFRVAHDSSEKMRLIATHLPGGGRLLTGHVVESESRFTIILEEAIASALAVAVALAAFAAWSSARLIDHKLSATAVTARAVAEGDLHQRVPLDGGGDAFDMLGMAINAMLDRIAALMNELKIATDGLAHDLRSPLTRLRATLERALARADRPEAQTEIGRAIEEGDRLLAMLDTALRITRAEAGFGRDSFVETDVGAMIEDLVEMYGPVAEDRGLTLAADAPPGLRADVHRDLLGQALANLVDNALKYGAGHIGIGARRDASGLIVTVADDGPGIAPEQRPEALRRFGRLDAARSSTGAGLGLSLAAAVAHLHGGRLELDDNAPGLRVVMHLGTRPDSITYV